MSLTGDYFDRVYASADDPWGFGSRWYEHRKYAFTLAALPAPSYDSGLEIGCSIGILTTQLAQRCHELTAVDLSPAALEAARARVPPSVRLLQGGVPDGWPAGSYDLVVLSEVGYYLDEPDLGRLLDLVERDLRPGGTVVACHWRHAVADYPLTGDQVHQALARWPRLSRVEEEDFLLDVLVPDGWPAGSYDLVVLSEVGYYLDGPDLQRLLDLVERDLRPGGTVVACHWRHPVADYPLTGDQVHEALARWPRLSRVEEEDFLLDVLAPGGADSVARREGLLG